MDWTELIAWLGWAVTIVSALWNGWRPAFLRPEDLSPKRAQLVNAYGRLDSVRTITGPPPKFIECSAGRYYLDNRTTGTHYTYRKQS